MSSSGVALLDLDAGPAVALAAAALAFALFGPGLALAFDTGGLLDDDDGRPRFLDQTCKVTQYTGLFTASGHFDTPLISVVDGPILKPFGVVIVITGWFGLVYNNA